MTDKYRQFEVLCIAKDSINLVEQISLLAIFNKNEEDLACFHLNRLIIEARHIIKGRGPTAQANTEQSFIKLGV